MTAPCWASIVALPPKRDMRRFPRPTSCANSAAYSCQKRTNRMGLLIDGQTAVTSEFAWRDERTAHSYDDVARGHQRQISERPQRQQRTTPQRTTDTANGPTYIHPPLPPYPVMGSALSVVDIPARALGPSTQIRSGPPTSAQVSSPRKGEISKPRVPDSTPAVRPTRRGRARRDWRNGRRVASR